MLPPESGRNSRIRVNTSTLEVGRTSNSNCVSPIRMDDTRPGPSNPVSSPRRERRGPHSRDVGYDYDYEQLKDLPEEALLELYLEKIKRGNGHSGDLALYLLDGNANNMLLEVYENDSTNYWERDADPTLWVPEHAKSRERSWLLVEEEQLAIAEEELYSYPGGPESEVRYVQVEGRAPSWSRKYGMNGDDDRRMIMLSRGPNTSGERN